MFNAIGNVVVGVMAVMGVAGMDIAAIDIAARGIAAVYIADLAIDADAGVAIVRAALHTDTDGKRWYG